GRRRPGGGRGLFLRQHRTAQPRAWDGGSRALVEGVARAVPLAGAALGRLRLRRRLDGDRLPRSRPVRPGRVRGAAAPDAQDPGGVPPAHAQERAEAPRGGRDDPDPERLAREGQPPPARALDGGDGIPLGHSGRPRRLYRRSLAARAGARARDLTGARELRPPTAELDLLGHAALFHDIGKLAVPDAILLKPATLTEDEWDLMQRHAEEGARIIDRLRFLQEAGAAIRHHHERFDVTG